MYLNKIHRANKVIKCKDLNKLDNYKNDEMSRKTCEKVQFKKEFPIHKNKTKHISQRRAMHDVTASEREQELQMVHVQLKTEARAQTLCTSVKNALRK